MIVDAVLKEGEEILCRALGERAVVTRFPVEGDRLVLKGVSPTGHGAFLKAAADVDVVQERRVLECLGLAGCRVPEILAFGSGEHVPGHSWLVMESAEGEEWEPEPASELEITTSLRSLAKRLGEVHSVRLGEQALLNDGKGWSSWVSKEFRDSVRVLVDRGCLGSGGLKRLEEAFSRSEGVVYERTDSLLHGDLDPREVFLDESGEVICIVDWGGALMGDPIYDLARFACGRPASDPRPIRLHPTLLAEYADLAGMGMDDLREPYLLYRMCWDVRHAARYVGSQDESVWIPGLVARAQQFAQEILEQT